MVKWWLCYFVLNIVCSLSLMVLRDLPSSSTRTSNSTLRYMYKYFVLMLAIHVCLCLCTSSLNCYQRVMLIYCYPFHSLPHSMLVFLTNHSSSILLRLLLYLLPYLLLKPSWYPSTCGVLTCKHVHMYSIYFSILSQVLLHVGFFYHWVYILFCYFNPLLTSLVKGKSHVCTCTLYNSGKFLWPKMFVHCR